MRAIPATGSKARGAEGERERGTRAKFKWPGTTLGAPLTKCTWLPCISLPKSSVTPQDVVHVYACTYYLHTRCVHVREAPSDQLARIQGFPRPSPPRRDGDSVRVSPAYPWVRLSAFSFRRDPALRLREHGSSRFMDIFYMARVATKWPQSGQNRNEFVTFVWKFCRHRTMYLF